MKSIVLSVIFFCSTAIINFAISQSPTKIKAILIVGHQEDLTASAIDEMNKIAEYLKSNQVEVYSFYDTKANWDSIKTKARQCNILIYSGHGTTLGPDSKPGGLCLTDIISTATIQNEFEMKPNSLVIFQSVCLGAGTSASDDKDIGIKEAQTRVESYASSFEKSGCVAYYANNYSNGAVNFLKEFFAVKSLYDSFEVTATRYTTIELNALSITNPSKHIGIATSPGGGISTVTTYENGVKSVKTVKSNKGYDVAFYGKKDYSLKTLNSGVK